MRIKEQVRIACTKPKVKLKLHGESEVWVDMMLTNIKYPDRVYYVSDQGRIGVYIPKYNQYRITFDPASTKQKGHYYEWGLNGSSMPVHRLVAFYFFNTPLDSNLDVHHINGDKHDNRLCNLEILSRREHHLRDVEAGRRPSADEIRIQQRKYTPEQVRHMRELYNQGRSMSSIAREYDYQFGTIRQIVKYMTYKDIE